MPEESTKENAEELNWSNVDPPKRAKGTSISLLLLQNTLNYVYKYINTSFKCKKCYIHILGLIVTN